MSAENDSRMPTPPFPHPDSDLLWIIIDNAWQSYATGESSVKGAIIHAAVHGWFEGHLEGEDSCPGCNFRGDDNHQHLRGIERENWIREQLRRSPDWSRRQLGIIDEPDEDEQDNW